MIGVNSPEFCLGHVTLWLAIQPFWKCGYLLWTWLFPWKQRQFESRPGILRPRHSEFCKGSMGFVEVFNFLCLVPSNMHFKQERISIVSCHIAPSVLAEGNY